MFKNTFSCWTESSSYYCDHMYQVVSKSSKTSLLVWQCTKFIRQFCSIISYYILTPCLPFTYLSVMNSSAFDIVFISSQTLLFDGQQLAAEKKSFVTSLFPAIFTLFVKNQYYNTVINHSAHVYFDLSDFFSSLLRNTLLIVKPR